MADREKILKGLECCCQMNGNVCRTECPYGDECIENECVGTAHLCANALELLKEQQETITSLQRTICKLNAALAEQKHGHWILCEKQRREEVENGNFYYLCSQCNRGDVHAKTQDVPYCCWCGAMMNEVKQDETN